MRLFYILFLFPIFFLQQPSSLQAQAPNPGVVSTKLLQRMAENPGGRHAIHIVMADRVDLASLDAALSTRRALPSQRAATVLTALKEKASSTQAALLSFLNDSNQGHTAHPYWVANAIFTQAGNELIAQLSHRADVAWIGLNGKLEVEAVESSCTPPAPPPPHGREAGIDVIGAPALWAMGYTGYGQVAFTNDTGVDPTHPALATKYRGLYVPGKQAWFDYDTMTQSQSDNTTPFDCDLHGTHVSGTILGLDRLAFDTIGVAFNAQWMGGAILCGIGTEDNVAAFQWALDPDDDPSTVGDMPDVINNSWYDPSLDTVDCFSVYVPVLQAMEAAGIAVVFSAGNEGPGTGTITQPHNVNLNEVNSFTVGALNGNTTSLPIASFSSRGPSHCPATDSSLMIKPEVSAPGVDVRSCIPGGGYTLLSGTSMASPHTSGAILLLKEAFPYLPGKEFKLALYHSCTDLGLVGEDNTYGMGVINVKAAFDYLVAQGNVPVSPYVSRDLMLLDLRVSSLSCDLSIQPTILVENAGSDTITSFEVSYEAGLFSNNYTWTGTLAPLERKAITLPPLAAVEGSYDLKCSLANPNNLADERPLNNFFLQKTTVVERLPFQAFVEGSTTACEGTQALLRTNYQGPGTADVAWYDDPFGGNLVGNGVAFATPVLTTADTFYAQATYHVPAGPTDHLIGDTALVTAQNLGLQFEVAVDCKLKSVKVFAEKAGYRQIQLQDEDGEQLAQVINPPSMLGEGRIELGWDLKAGKQYRIVKKGGKALFCNTTGADFPYESSGLLSITGTTDGQTEGSYYFFYDWDLERAEPCGRTAVPVEVMPGAAVPTASFSLSADSVEVGQSDSNIQFTNTSTGSPGSYQWNFGDGVTSIEENPSHTYASPGNYVVSLAVESPEGCTGFALDTIQVVAPALSGVATGLRPEKVQVFPNPVNNQLFVHLQLNQPQQVGIQISDLAGRPVKTMEHFTSSTATLPIDLSDLKAGIYFILIKTSTGQSVWKVVKI